LFQDINIEDPSLSDNSRVERGITVNVLVPAEVVGTFLGQDCATMNAIQDITGCIEMDMEGNIRADHRRITMHVPTMDVAHQVENIIINVVRAHEEGALEYIKKSW
jgi:hypothetical protein